MTSRQLWKQTVHTVYVVRLTKFFEKDVSIRANAIDIALCRRRPAENTTRPRPLNLMMRTT